MKQFASCLGLALALLPIVMFGGERPVESYLPADAFVAILYDGGHPGLRDTPLHRFFQEPEVAAAMEQIAPLWDALARQAGEGAGLDLTELVRVASGSRLVVALARGTEQTFGPAVLLAAHVGEEPGPAREAAQALLRALQADAAPGEVKDLPIGGATLKMRTAIVGPPKCFGLVGPVFLMGNAPALLRRALDPAAPKLALPDRAEAAVLRIRYDHRALLQAVRPELEQDPQMRKVLAGLGLDAVRGAELAVVPRGKRLVTLFDVALAEGQERVGLAKWLADSPPVDRQLLRKVPRESMAFYATSADLARLWDEVWATIERIDPAAAREGLEGLAELEQRLGVKIREGLLASLDPGMVVITQGTTWMGGGTVLLLRTRDGDALEANLVRMINRLDLLLMQGPVFGPVRTQLKPFTYRGHKCYYVWIMGTPALFLQGSVPAYTRVGDLFVLAQHPLYLKEYVDFLEDEGPSIVDHPDFQALADAVPERASMVSFAAWPDTVVAAYNSLAPFLMVLQGVPGLPAELDLANLPSSRLLRRYARGTVLTSVFQDGHYRVELQGEGLDILSPQTAPVAVGAILAGMLLPALARARAEARLIQNRSNLNQIARGCAVYLNEFGDNRFYPASLAELWDREIIPDPGIFVSPLDPDPPKLPNGLACSYVSCFDKYPDRQFLDDFPPNAIMAWDRVPFARGRRSVLFFDSHVELMTEAEFQEGLKQLERLVKELTRPRVGERAPGGRL